VYWLFFAFLLCCWVIRKGFGDLLESVLVIGGAGFLGSNLVEQLLEPVPFRDVFVLDNFSSGKQEWVHRWANIIGADIVKDEQLFLNKYDVIFHLAANPDIARGVIEPKLDLEQNTIGTSNVLECMRKKDCEKIIFASSGSVYGQAAKLPTMESYPTEPISLYGASKLACESMIRAYCELYGFKAVIFRIANICGKHQWRALEYLLIKQFKTEGKFHIFEDGKQTRGFIHVSDCSSAFVHGWKGINPKSCEVFNLATTDIISVNEVANIVENELGKKKDEIPRIRGEPTWKGDIRYTWLDVSKIKATGWGPKYDSRKAVQVTVNEILQSWTK